MTPYDLRFNNFYGPSFGIISLIYICIIFCSVAYDKNKNQSKLFNLLLTILKTDSRDIGDFFLAVMCFILIIITYIICHYTFIEKAANEKHPDKIIK